MNDVETTEQAPVTLKPSGRLNEEQKEIFDRLVRHIIDKGSEPLQGINTDNFTYFARNARLLQIYYEALMVCKNSYEVERRFPFLRTDLLVDLRSKKEFRDKLRHDVKNMIEEFAEAATKLLPLTRPEIEQILGFPLKIDKQKFLEANRDTGFFRSME